jgi:molybdopterin molybdotransferase
LLETGTRARSGSTLAAASANHATLPVTRRKPLVAIIATGDELLPPGSEVGPDQIIASNSYGVAALCVRKPRACSTSASRQTASTRSSRA